MKRNQAVYVKIPDKNGNFNRVVKSWRFPDSHKTFFFEPRFMLSQAQDKIVRKDDLYEHDEIFGMKGCGFLPCNLKDYRNYCREQYAKYKEEEVFINPIAIAYGMVEPAYDDKAVISPKYHI